MRQYLRELFVFLKSRSYPTDYKWTKEDAIAWKAFLDKDTGHKLLSRMICESYEQDRQATVRMNGHEYAAGVAVGFRLAVGALQSFTQSAADVDNNANAGGVDALRERITPK